jgi:hypothetical protein
VQARCDQPSLAPSAPGQTAEQRRSGPAALHECVVYQKRAWGTSGPNACWTLQMADHPAACPTARSSRPKLPTSEPRLARRLLEWTRLVPRDGSGSGLICPTSQSTASYSLSPDFAYGPRVAAAYRRIPVDRPHICAAYLGIPADRSRPAAAYPHIVVNRPPAHNHVFPQLGRGHPHPSKKTCANHQPPGARDGVSSPLAR